MTDNDQESSSIPNSDLSDDLPPVQPPSAAFIFQLFLFPALIVLGVVAIWLMFGLISSGEQDWQRLVQEMQSQNLQIRNRAMNGMAEVLKRDLMRGEQGQHLRTNREIAQVMSDQLMSELRKNSTSKEAVAIQLYLIYALQYLDTVDLTTPALVMAMEPGREVDLRKSAVFSLGQIAGRALEKLQPLESPAAVESLIQMTSDQIPVLRHSATFALGVFQSYDVTQQLEVLLQSGDPLVRINAAIALARQKSAAGYPVIVDSLKSAEFTEVKSPNQTPEEAAKAANQTAEQFLILKNILQAVNDLAAKLDANQRQELVPLLEKLSASHPEERIRINAASALIALKAAQK